MYDLLFTDEKFNIVLNYLKSNIFTDLNIKKLINECEKYGDVYLIGGSVKDVAFLNKAPKDYDLIVLSNDKLDLQLPSCFDIVKNSFGGYKLKYNNILFDIWNCKDEDSILNTSVYFNTDGLFINLTKSNYNSVLYNQAIISGCLEVINKNINHPNSSRDYNRGLEISQKLGLKLVE